VFTRIAAKSWCGLRGTAATFGRKTERKKFKVMIEKRVKSGLAIAPSVLRLCDVNLKLAEISSRNDFVEKAIKFYAGYLNAENNPEFLNDLFSTQAEKAIREIGDKLARDNYKIAVELAKLCYLIVGDRHISTSQLQDLEELSRSNVLHMKGTLHIGDLY
jgi:hypothetical protein